MLIMLNRLAIDTVTRSAFVEGRNVGLTDYEFRIVEFLALRRGETVTRSDMMAHLYAGMDEPEGKILDVFMSKTRRKLKAAMGESPIVTVWGRGYAIP